MGSIEIFERKNRNLTNLFRLAAKADRVYVMPSSNFVGKFYNFRTYAALPCRVLRHFLSLKCRSC